MTIDFKIIFLFIAFILLLIIFINVMTWTIKSLIHFLSRENITNYFTATKTKKKKRKIYIINQNMSKKGKAEITKLREDMTDMRIRDKMKEVGRFFDKQLNILFKSLAENNYSELQIKTHLGRKLEQAKEDGYLESVFIKRNGTCSLTAKSHCQKYTWKTFKTYRIKLNIDKILSSDFSE